MTGHRYRVNKVKRMHAILDGIAPVLEQIAQHPLVHQVTPGRIQPKRRGKEQRITLQYPTDSGLKLLAHTPKAVQEVFIVTSEPQTVKAYLIDAELIKNPGECKG